jgi:hypothetical protein
VSALDHAQPTIRTLYPLPRLPLSIRRPDWTAEGRSEPVGTRLPADLDGITVNAVAPGITATERVLNVRTPEEDQAGHRVHPDASSGRTGDCGGGVVLLASERATFITGATLDVNGWPAHGLRGRSLERDLYSDDVPSLDRRITSSLTAVT